MRWVWGLLFCLSAQAVDLDDPAVDDRRDSIQTISLKSVIEQGLRENTGERKRVIDREIIELRWKDTYDSYWLPKFSAKIVGESGLSRLYESGPEEPGKDRVGSQYLQVGFEDYTVFDWGKQYLQYQNTKTDYNYNRNSLDEQKRALRLELIRTYSELVHRMNRMQVRRDQLRMMTVVHRLMEQRIQAKKGRPQELLQAKLELARARDQFIYQKYLYRLANQKLAVLLKDRPTTVYRLREKFIFKELHLNLKSINRYVEKRSPRYLLAKARFEQADRSYQWALKGRLPLPEIKLSLGARKYAFTKNGRTSSTESSRDGDIDLVASLNFEIPIFGDEGGFLNQRKSQIAFLQKQSALIELDESRRVSELQSRTLYQAMRTLERHHRSLRKEVQIATRLEQRVKSNVTTGKTLFINYKLALESLVNARLDQIESREKHIQHKLELAYLMGVDDLPGHFFERMVAQ